MKNGTHGVLLQGTSLDDAFSPMPLGTRALSEALNSKRGPSIYAHESPHHLSHGGFWQNQALDIRP